MLNTKAAAVAALSANGAAGWRKAATAALRSIRDCCLTHGMAAAAIKPKIEIVSICEGKGHPIWIAFASANIPGNQIGHLWQVDAQRAEA